MTRSAKPRGQAMVEFALIFPIFILLLVGIFDLGRVIWVNDTLATAAREAVRFAIVHGEKSPCPVGPPAPGAVIPAAGPGCLNPAPSRQAIKDLADEWAAGTSTDITVNVCYGAVTACTSDTDAVGATDARGTQVMVTVTSVVGLSIPSLVGFTGFSLTASSTMMVNH
ncbi:MAG: pilus assembly protein [Chloroflexi bacterium]|nr:pilus assembly protein [Chloroflexota bacterium]